MLSGSTAVVDRSRKMPIYARAGVQFAWLVDPRVKSLEAFRLEAGEWRSLGNWVGQAEVRAEPFSTTPVGLDRLWLPDG